MLLLAPIAACDVVTPVFACALYVGMLLLAPIAACDVVIPVFDCVIDLSILYSLLKCLLCG